MSKMLGTECFIKRNGRQVVGCCFFYNTKSMGYDAS